MNKKKIYHIYKEMNNDVVFQLRKIILRVKILLMGAIKIKSSIKLIRNVKDFEIVIYTLGKSGSSSIYYTLMSKLPFKKIYHVHFLSDYFIKDIFPGTPHERNIHKAEYYFKHINKKNKIKYITVVREPIGRDISGFFQNYRLTGVKFDKNDLESIRKIISNNGHELATTWFDTEFYNHTGFDIYKIPFDNKTGYQIYKIDENTEVLVILTHRLTEVFEEAIKKYLNITIEKMINFNISSEKKDKTVINNIKNYYYEDNSQIKKIYSKKFVKHFFNDNEINNYIKRWSINKKS